MTDKTIEDRAKQTTPIIEVIKMLKFQKKQKHNDYINGLIKEELGNYQAESDQTQKAESLKRAQVLNSLKDEPVENTDGVTKGVKIAEVAVEAASVFAGLVSVAMILNYEKTDVVTSKALSIGTKMFKN